MRHAPMLLLALLALLVGCAGRTAPFEARFNHGAVAADHAAASEAGAEMLRRGGNAVDAAVATSFTLSVVRPESCGIGGGGFMVIHLSGGSPIRGSGGVRGGPLNTAINYREMAPAAVGPDFFEKLDSTSSTHGGKAVGVPGTVAGLLYALDHYGTLDRKTVLAPAIRAAEQGFRADAHYITEVRDVVKDFTKHPEFRTRFAFVWEHWLHEGRVEVGDRIFIPGQAQTLRAIAEQGPSAFYEGPIADAIVEAIHRDGGPMTGADLKAFKVAEVEPLRFTFMDRVFLTMPPPSSGGVALAEALGILDQAEGGLFKVPFRRYLSLLGGAVLHSLPFAKDPRAEPVTLPPAQAATAVEEFRSSSTYIHLVTEASKHAFADRSRWLGDPAFVDVPAARLTSGEYARARAATLSQRRTLPPEAYGTNDGTTAPEDHGTSHFCVVDRWGSAVSCTETVNLGFGACLAVERFGILLNDQMDDFTTRRGKANAFGLRQSERNLPAPGKRPLSSMTPAIVLDAQGQVVAIAGASGGPRIISGTMQALLNVLWFESSAGDAVRRPRFHHQWSPNTLRLEPDLMKARTTDDHDQPVPLRSALETLGHTIQPIDSVAAVQLIKRDGERWDAACDPRKGGRPAGH